MHIKKQNCLDLRVNMSIEGALLSDSSSHGDDGVTVGVWDYLVDTICALTHTTLSFTPSYMMTLDMLHNLLFIRTFPSKSGKSR